MARRVTAPDGRQWVVGRRWLPWRWRLRRPHRALDQLDADPGCLLEGLEGLVAAIAVVVAVVLFVLFVVPVLIALIEIAALGVLVLLGVLARVALRRPWIVDARVVGNAGVPLSWKVVGWRRSGEVVDEVARQLETRAGVIAPPDAEPC